MCLILIVGIGCQPPNSKLKNKDDFLNPNKPNLSQCKASMPLNLKLKKTKPNEFNFKVYHENNIPHIKAESLEELSFASGYVFADQNYCSFQKQIILMKGESAKNFGPHKFNSSDDPLDGDMFYLTNDLFSKTFEFLKKAKFIYPQLSDTTKIVFSSYAKGINKFKQQNNITCDFTKNLSQEDIYAYFLYLTALKNYKSVFYKMIKTKISAQAEKHLTATNSWPSYAFAAGEQKSKNIKSTLLASHSAPVDGPFKLFEMQLIIPNQLNTYGVSTNGFPLIQMGFNKNLAWTHNKSSEAVNYLLYELERRDNFYMYNGNPYMLSSSLVQVPYKSFGGGENIWSVVLPSTHLGWAIHQNNKLYALQENLLSNADMIEHWLRYSLSRSVNDIKKIHQNFRGIPSSHTIATDRSGKALFIDSSRVFKLSRDTQLKLKTSLKDLGQPIINAQESDLPLKNYCSESITDHKNIPSYITKKQIWNSGNSYAHSIKHNSSYTSPVYGLKDKALSQRAQAVYKVSNRTTKWDNESTTSNFLFNNKSDYFLSEKSKIYNSCKALEYERKLTTEDCLSIAQWDGDFNGTNSLEVVIKKLKQDILNNNGTSVTTEDFKNMLLNAFRFSKNIYLRKPLMSIGDHSLSGGQGAYGVINEASYSHNMYEDKKPLELDAIGLIRNNNGEHEAPINTSLAWAMSVDFFKSKPQAWGLSLLSNNSEGWDKDQLSIYNQKKLRELKFLTSHEFERTDFKSFTFKAD